MIIVAISEFIMASPIVRYTKIHGKQFCGVEDTHPKVAH